MGGLENRNLSSANSQRSILWNVTLYYPLIQCPTSSIKCHVQNLFILLKDETVQKHGVLDNIIIVCARKGKKNSKIHSNNYRCLKMGPVNGLKIENISQFAPGVSV